MFLIENIISICYFPFTYLFLSNSTDDNKQCLSYLISKKVFNKEQRKRLQTTIYIGRKRHERCKIIYLDDLHSYHFLKESLL